MSLYYVFSEAVRSFERFTTEFAGVTATAKVCGGSIADLQFVIVLLRRHGVGGASVDVVVVIVVSGAVGNGFGLVPSPV